MTTHTRRTAAVAALVVALVAGMLTAPNAVAQRIITLTLVRHAQSEGNASGLIDTSTPGPPLTALDANRPKPPRRNSPPGTRSTGSTRPP